MNQIPFSFVPQSHCSNMSKDNGRFGNGIFDCKTVTPNNSDIPDNMKRDHCPSLIRLTLHCTCLCNSQFEADSLCRPQIGYCRACSSPLQWWWIDESPMPSCSSYPCSDLRNSAYAWQHFGDVLQFILSPGHAICAIAIVGVCSGCCKREGVRLWVPQ